GCGAVVVQPADRCPVPDPWQPHRCFIPQYCSGCQASEITDFCFSKLASAKRSPARLGTRLWGWRTRGWIDGGTSHARGKSSVYSFSGGKKDKTDCESGSRTQSRPHIVARAHQTSR